MLPKPSPQARRRPGIFCLEGEWTNSLTSTLSVRPQLEMLVPHGISAVPIHRDVATREELFYYLDKWLQPGYERYTVGYLAFHGEESCIGLGQEEVTLDELADSLGERARGRVLYFGSCGTLAAPDGVLHDFVLRTGVKAICGYTKEVEWLYAAAFDFILLPLLLRRRYLKTVYRTLADEHVGFVHGLGFRLVTKDFMSPRELATAARSSAGPATSVP
jgi:hypothetical protein